MSRCKTVTEKMKDGLLGQVGTRITALKGAALWECVRRGDILEGDSFEVGITDKGKV